MKHHPKQLIFRKRCISAAIHPLIRTMLMATNHFAWKTMMMTDHFAWKTRARKLFL